MGGGCTHRWEAEGVHKTYHGHVDSSVFRRSINTTTSTPQFDHVRYIVNDLSGITGHSLAAQDFAYLAAIRRMYDPVKPDLRVAFVTTDVALGQAILAGVESTLTEHSHVAIFATVAAARAWCGAGDAA
jgi:hypothetical protein